MRSFFEITKYNFLENISTWIRHHLFLETSDLRCSIQILCSRKMDGHSKRTRHNKSSKQNRKSRPSPLAPIVSGEIASQFHHSLEALTNRSAGNDRLNDIIDNITSEGDDLGAGSSSKLSSKSSTSKLIEPNSPPVNDNHSSLYALPSSHDTYSDRTSSASSRRSKRFSPRDRKLQQQLADRKSFSPSRTGSSGDRADSAGRRKSIGDQRRHELTECMEDYRYCLESAQNSNTIGITDDPNNSEKRKQYTTTLW